MPWKRSLARYPGERTSRADLRAVVAPWAGPWLVVVGFAALVTPWYAPARNELVYMMVLRAKANPGFLAGDWTYSGPFTEHLVFNTLFAPLTSILSIEAVAWIGRVATWAVAAAVLLALARTLGARPWASAAALVVWLAVGQSVVARTWMIGTFEAKTIAYPLLVGALVAAMRGRVPWAAALAGLSLTFHPAVGLWGGLAIGTALVVERTTRREALRWSWLAALTAAPGIAATIWGLFGGAAQDWRYVVVERFPYHLDPFTFPRRGLGLLALMLTISLLAGWALRADLRFRIVSWFQTGLGVFFAIGVIARMLESWQVLAYFPFRLLSLLVPLITLLYGARLVDREQRASFSGALRRGSATARAIAVLGVVAGAWMLLLVNPIDLAADRVRVNLDGAQEREDEMADAFRWSGENLPTDAVVVFPPWRGEAAYLAERAHVASWSAFRYDASVAWRDRIAAHLGAEFDGADTQAVAEALYPLLTEADVALLAERYGATHIVTDGALRFPAVHRVGDVTVYEIPTP